MEIVRVDVTLLLGGGTHLIASYEGGRLTEYMNVNVPYVMKLVTDIARKKDLRLVVTDQPTYARMTLPLVDPVGWDIKITCFKEGGFAVLGAQFEESTFWVDKALSRASIAEALNKIAVGELLNFPFRFQP